ncbi:hypothetical protein KSS87_001402 [Heliosperma pusillum]|nr:hypothetical protein KSS87_001402 [Heliosperma pusillum]
MMLGICATEFRVRCIIALQDATLFKWKRNEVAFVQVFIQRYQAHWTKRRLSSVLVHCKLVIIDRHQQG